MADVSAAGRPDSGTDPARAVTPPDAVVPAPGLTDAVVPAPELTETVVPAPGPTEPVVPAPAYGSRREARERALSLLYEADAKDITPAALLDEVPVVPPPFVISLVAGVGERQEQIDRLIDRFAIDWTIDRMPVIDRTIVRMATFELLHRPDVPTGVVISEAVELAKRFSTEESGRFVNGVLASIAAETRAAPAPD
jgi:N utilization substance protein B